MGKIETNIQLAERAKKAATDFKTLYVMGCFGAPLNSKNKTRYCNNHSYNKKEERTKMIMNASEDTFGFDCVCLLKGLLWGWTGDTSKTYGGAVYKSNNVPDINADDMFSCCIEQSSDFSNIQIGEAVWIKGHIGVYVGDGLAVESTPRWKNGAQLTACNCNVSGYNRRNWTKHGKLPYIKYIEQPSAEKQPERISTVLSIEETKKCMWNVFMQELNNPFGVAGLMANIQAESNFLSNNLQNTYSKKFGLSDDEYSHKINCGTYRYDNYTTTEESFYRDKAGYGLAQWTYWSRKKALIDYIFNKTTAGIDDTVSQIVFLLNEIKGYKNVWNTLKNATSVREASDVVLLEYERPADQSEAVRVKRATYGEKIYNEFVKDTPAYQQEITVNDVVIPCTSSDIDYLVKTILSNGLVVTAIDDCRVIVSLELNIQAVKKIGSTGRIKILNVNPYTIRVARNLPTSYYKEPNTKVLAGQIKTRGTYTIVKETSDGLWGYLKSGAGWIELKDVDKI